MCFEIDQYFEDATFDGNVISGDVVIGVAAAIKVLTMIEDDVCYAAKTRNVRDKIMTGQGKPRYHVLFVVTERFTG